MSVERGEDARKGFSMRVLQHCRVQIKEISADSRVLKWAQTWPLLERTCHGLIEASSRYLDLDYAAGTWTVHLILALHR